MIPEDRAVEPIESDRSLGELFSRLGSDLSELISAQIALAKVELRDEARQAGQALAMTAAAAVFGFLALLLLCFAAAWGLAEVLPEGVAFLVVGLVVAVIAAALGLMGKKRIEAAREVAPETIDTIKEDVQWTRRQMS